MAVIEVHDQWPCASATTSQSTWPSIRTVTVLPTSAVPVVVIGSVRLWPACGAETTGAFGALVSRVNETDADSPLVPFGSLALAVTAWGPSVKAGETLHEK